MTDQTLPGPNAQTAVITGASSGIGAAAALKLANNGYQVVLIARSQDRLQALADKIRHDGGCAFILPADLSQENERVKLLEDLSARFGCPDVLLNNAGIGWYGYLAEMPWKIANEMIEVNVQAVVQLSLYFLKGMLRRNAGHIINIGSITGDLPFQGSVVYGGTKAFLASFTSALYRETRGTQVKISVLRAGPVKTDFFENTSNRSGALPLPGKQMGVTADYVATRILHIIQKPKKTVYVPGYMAITPWAELIFGGLIDRLGPLLLRRHKTIPTN